MLFAIRDKIFFVLICFLWYYVGKSSETLGVILIVATYLLLIARGMYQEQLLSLMFLIILSDNYFLYFSQTAKPIILILLSLNVFLNKEISMQSSFYKSFIPFFVFAAITLSLSPYFSYSFARYSSYLLLFTTVPTFSFFLYEKYGNEFLKNWIYLCLIILLISIISKYIGNSYAVIRGGRFRGVFGNPNGLAIFCVFVIMFFEVSRKHLKCYFSKTEVILFYLVVGLSVLWAGSRNAMLAIFLFFLFAKLSKISPFIGFLILILFVFLSEYIISLAVDILIAFGFKDQLRLGGDQSIEKASGRIVAWTFGWQEIQKNFFTGLGWSYDELLFEDPKVQAKLNMLNHQGGVHNSFLALWLNQGVIGLALFLFALIGTFLKAAKKSPYALAVMYSCFFMANFEAWMSASLNPYTIQMIIILSMIIFVDKDEIDKTNNETKDL